MLYAVRGEPLLDAYLCCTRGTFSAPEPARALRMGSCAPQMPASGLLQRPGSAWPASCGAGPTGHRRVEVRVCAKGIVVHIQGLVCVEKLMP
jgi:hypothetical protein